MTEELNGTNNRSPAGAELFAKDEALDRLGGDVELLAMTVEIFLQELSNMISDVTTGVVEGNAPGLKLAAHTLKGAAGNIGAPGIAAISFELEKMGTSGDLAQAALFLDQLKAEAQRLEPVLNEFMQVANVP